MTTTENPERFEAAIARVDAANREDPNVESFQGEPIAKELLYSERMTAWLDRLAPDAPEPVRLAARCQHLRRWTIPRDGYPMTRSGYRQWRTELGKFHAAAAADILRDVDYDEETIERVRSLLRKEDLKSDPDMQLLEDVICLVFLENHFDDFSRQHEEDKLIAIVRKVWHKMSPRGHEAALGLPMTDENRALLKKALGPSDDAG